MYQRVFGSPLRCPARATSASPFACLLPVRPVARSLSSTTPHRDSHSQVRVYSPPPRKRQRLYLSGVDPFLPPRVRGSSSPFFREVQLSNWLASLGVADTDVQVTKIAAGHDAHFMLAYRMADTGEESIFAIGRGESGQLGIGYNSQVGQTMRWSVW